MASQGLPLNASELSISATKQSAKCRTCSVRQSVNSISGRNPTSVSAYLSTPRNFSPKSYSRGDGSSFQFNASNP